MKVLQKKHYILFLLVFVFTSCGGQAVEVDRLGQDLFTSAYKLYKQVGKRDILITSIKDSVFSLVITELFQKLGAEIPKQIVINNIDDLFVGCYEFKDTDRILVVGDVISDKKELVRRLYKEMWCRVPEENVSIINNPIDIKIDDFMDSDDYLPDLANYVLEKHGNKLKVRLSQVVLYSCILAEKIIASGFRPDYIVGLWRGGSGIGEYMKEVFKRHNISIKDVVAIRSSAYNEKDELQNEVKIFDHHFFWNNTFEEDDKILIVDDLIDSGASMEKMLEILAERCYGIPDENKKVATLFCKEGSHFEPDFYLLSHDRWLVFPHELAGLTLKETAKIHGPKVRTMVESSLRSSPVKERMC